MGIVTVLISLGLENNYWCYIKCMLYWCYPSSTVAMVLFLWCCCYGAVAMVLLIWCYPYGANTMGLLLQVVDRFRIILSIGHGIPRAAEKSMNLSKPGSELHWTNSSKHDQIRHAECVDLQICHSDNDSQS
jgi:hypothetical protein